MFWVSLRRTSSLILQPFHLAIPVTNLERARQFYGETLQLREGRSDPVWQDYDFFGHQLVLHKVEENPRTVEPQKPSHNEVGKAILLIR